MDIADLRKFGGFDGRIGKVSRFGWADLQKVWRFGWANLQKAWRLGGPDCESFAILDGAGVRRKTERFELSWENASSVEELSDQWEATRELGFEPLPYVYVYVCMYVVFEGMVT